ncbi:aminotransferase class V-fold PLP-dependent enzyme [Pseudomonas alliivorans]|uniref:cysteine desulfurase n=1 Tax=Pseudomonas alliivorans TaxID=2810613 RepID=A0ABS4C5I2_9PSED|nr:aminotransferase class V-fold PLP-dependent enzyme [Pseudomonas alliivorans]MBP0945798.1 aminotransferase class V-fold PLP-dependent enzyme [Pseudomonas alliivorans]MEE4326319.1 aminotransferase class V-fold PLP-dependent enzyme [Pseudomonas alliivorans]MEE4367849.1 aminotransferase class V-fold PLP-dependent enzyme [Pseudomonas alliivorans]
MTTTALYLDYAATTPVDEQVIEAMVACLGREGHFGNPASSGHGYGQVARQAVEQARRQVADAVGAPAETVIWTSGATESNNLAIKGIAHDSTAQRRHIITSALEHKAVIDTVKTLERQGFAVTWLQPDANGLIQPQAVQAALREDTLLVSLMLVNNELGTLTDIASIGTLVRGHGALFHVDAAQAVGKVKVDLASLAVDLMSFSAHKAYGPKGIGALYIGPRAHALLQAQIHGGGHEGGFRSGTLATHQIVGMGEAFALAIDKADAENCRIAELSSHLREGLLALPDVQLNGCPEQRIPHTLNLCITRNGFTSAQLSHALALSSTSACNSASNAPSHVLLALGLDTNKALASVRVSLGRYTTQVDVERTIEVFSKALTAPAAFW